MKIYFCKQSRLGGSVLMMTMIVTTIVGIALASYLYLIRFQNISVVHSQAWNASLAVAEAGVEEALAQLNSGVKIGLPLNWSGNGWIQSGSNYVAPQRALGSSYYNVKILPGSTAVIYSTGYTAVTYSGVTAARVVRVTATNQSLFSVAMAAQKTIDLIGNDIAIDSYDSTDSRYSTGGYYDPTKSRDHADVATNNGLTNSFSAGNANIKGRIRTGPSGSPSIGPNGSVGSSAWVDGGNKGIENGWFSDDFNYQFPDVDPPFAPGSGATPKGGIYNGTNYTYIMGTDNYSLSTLSMKTGDKMLVAGDAVLYITGNVTMLGSAEIIVAPGASMKFYVGGASADVTLVNTAGSPFAFQYYGLPSNTSLTWGGNDEYVGTVYAPSATFTMGGGGNNIRDFQGSCVAGAVKMNGHFNFHYDESLARNGPSLGYVASSWSEL
ncbi:MAG: hypothetical protein HY298_10120 [Verrucomicrobia bacterium]|nr:hypothetical protein [Verrucomicrobiota bacterium]